MNSAGLISKLDKGRDRIDQNTEIKRESLKKSRQENSIELITELKQHNIVVVIPAFNEERFIGSVVIKARKYARSVIVVDDGSSDSTKEIAEGAGAIVIRHPVNRGKGTSLNTGFTQARKLGAEVVVLLDGDGQHRPDDIPHIARPIIEDKIDMVVGSRYVGAKSDIPGYRVAGQKIITLLTNVSSGVRSTDSWSGYRGFSKEALHFIRFREGGWGVDPEFQFQAREHGFRVAEVPIIALYEEKAKRNPIPHAVKTINAIVRMVGQHRPLLFFGSAGLSAILSSLIVGFWVIERFEFTHELATGSAIIAALLMILGTLSLFTGIVLHSFRSLALDLNHNSRS